VRACACATSCAVVALGLIIIVVVLEIDDATSAPYVACLSPGQRNFVRDEACHQLHVCVRSVVWRALALSDLDGRRRVGAHTHVGHRRPTVHHHGWCVCVLACIRVCMTPMRVAGATLVLLALVIFALDPETRRRRRALRPTMPQDVWTQVFRCVCVWGCDAIDSQMPGTNNYRNNYRDLTGTTSACVRTSDRHRYTHIAVGGVPMRDADVSRDAAIAEALLGYRALPVADAVTSVREEVCYACWRMHMSQRRTHQIDLEAGAGSARMADVAAPPRAALVASHLYKKFARKLAVADVSFHVQEKTVFGLLGPK
jgi:hypothetical protein